MRPPRLVLAVLLSGLALPSSPGCRRGDQASPTELKARIAALEREREGLRRRVGDLIAMDRRLQGLPDNAVRVGVPTPLVRTLVERLVAGFVDSVTLKLTKLRVHKSGKIKKVIPIGEYDLTVMIDEVTGNLKTGKPEIAFGGNQVSIALPVAIASGSGDATIDFVWDGKNVSGAVCGDMEIHQQVSGRVKPDSYAVRGSLRLSATTQQILASPRFPPLKVNLKVEPSAESWAAVQKILDDQAGLCGYVLDKVDIAGVLEGLIGKGFGVRLPTEKIRPMAVPVGIAPTMSVRGEPVTIGVKVGNLAITEHMVWLGADVALQTPHAR